MNDEETIQFARHEPRFIVRKPVATVARVAIRNPDHESPLMSGTVVDLSSTGMRLALDYAPAQGTEVTIHFCVPEIGVDLMRDGIVRWTQFKDCDSWWVGCSLDSALPQSSLEEMANKEILDRRDGARLPTACQVTAKWELSTKLVGATIVDYSVGGCSVTTKEPVDQTCDRMMLQFGAEDEAGPCIPVHIVWNHGDSKFGCEFASISDYFRVRRYLESESQAQERVQRTRRRRDSSQSNSKGMVWVAASLLVSLFVSGVNLIGHESELRHQIENGIQTIVDNVRPHNATEDAETLNVNDWAR